MYVDVHRYVYITKKKVDINLDQIWFFYVDKVYTKPILHKRGKNARNLKSSFNKIFVIDKEIYKESYISATLIIVINMYNHT